MSLRAAVEQILKDMEEAYEIAKKQDEIALKFALGAFASHLKIALTASEWETPQPLKIASKPRLNSEDLAVEVLTRIEEAGPGLVDCVGGPEDGTSVPIDPKMPPGAKTIISGAVYSLSLLDRKLHFSQEETDKLRSH